MEEKKTRARFLHVSHFAFAFAVSRLVSVAVAAHCVSQTRKPFLCHLCLSLVNCKKASSVPCHALPSTLHSHGHDVRLRVVLGLPSFLATRLHLRLVCSRLAAHNSLSRSRVLLIETRASSRCSRLPTLFYANYIFVPRRRGASSRALGLRKGKGNLNGPDAGYFTRTAQFYLALPSAHKSSS